MFTLKISNSLSRKLLRTNKSFICYNLTHDNTQIDDFVLTDDLHRYKNRYQSFKALSCIKKQFNTITF